MDEIAEMTELTAWLKERVQDAWLRDSPTTLVHGDLKLDSFIYNITRTCNANLILVRY